jgi:hypothetical protein
MDLAYPWGDGPWYYSPYSIKADSYGAEWASNYELTTDELHSGPPFKTGGPFDSISIKTDQFEVKGDYALGNYGYNYDGGFSHHLWPTNYLDHYDLNQVVSSGWGDASQYGAKAWNRYRPTRSGAEMGVFLGEIQEVPRMLRTTALGFRDVWRSMGGSLSGFSPKSVANHFLNTQFGWFPFLSDLRAFYKTQKTLDQALKQLRRDNGKWVRRRGTVTRDYSKENVVEQYNVHAGLWPPLVTYIYSSSAGGYVVSVERQTDVWFSGAFRYWIPGKPDSWEWKIRAISQLFGLQPSPSLLWELTPWSWLIDWCSDAGDAIANMSSIMFDNLCAKYAYVMAHTVQKAVYRGWQFCHPVGSITGEWSATLDRKVRLGASPFGFGLTSSSFSGRQWSILGALGLTRMR